jgi:molybdopterin converting factor small subunit
LSTRGTIRYWAAARDAAGCAEETYYAADLRAALAAAREGRDTRFVAVLERCSFLVDSAPVGARDHATIALSDGGVIEVLPPFAGGAN